MNSSPPNPPDIPRKPIPPELLAYEDRRLVGVARLSVLLPRSKAESE